MKNLLDRHPLVATFALMVVSGVVVAVVASNMSGIGGTIAGVRLILPWLALMFVTIAVITLAYMCARLAANWPRRLRRSLK